MQELKKQTEKAKEEFESKNEKEEIVLETKEKNKKKTISKRVILVVILLVTALISVFGISKIASSPKFHAKTIQTLDEKKITVMELTAATAGTSTAIALIPSDATTPLANQILELSSYLLIVIGAIFLEKVLLTLTGYITFTFLIPIACLLYGIYLFIKKDILRSLAIKLSVFGIVIFMVVPVSVQVSNLIEDTYQHSIDQTIEEAKNNQTAVEENAEVEEKNGWDQFASKVKDTISNIGENISEWVHKGEKALSNFIDAIAILLITSCVIPIAVLIFFIWIVKIIFGISIPIPKIKEKKDRIKNE